MNMGKDIFYDRCKRAQGLMGKKGIDYLFVDVGSDMFYLTNYETYKLERLVLFVLPREGQSYMITPSFEVPRFELGGIKAFFDVRAWEETEDPMDILTYLVDPAKPATIGLTDQMWGIFVLSIMKILPKANFVSASQVLAPMRMIKDPQEIEYLREAGRRIDKVWEDVLRLSFSGNTEHEMSEKIIAIQKKHFAPPARPPLFPVKPVESGPNSASPHGGGPDRVIQKSDGVMCELGGGSYLGYKTDMTRCCQVAPATEEYRKVYEVVKEAQQAAFETIRPGVTCESIDLAGRRVIEEAGYGEYFTHRLGHGLGLDFHEEPYIVKGNKTKLREGMVFSDEPGIYLPGKFGVRIQDIVMVTKDCAERLYNSTRELHTVD